MGKITVVGLGPGSMECLPAKTYNLLRSAPTIYFRTAKHPLVEELPDQGICFKSFDELYRQKDSFQEVYNSIVQILLEAADNGHVVYGVPGHPMVAEQTVQLLLQAAGDRCELEIIPAMSCLDALYVSLKLDPTKGLQIIDCLELLTPGDRSINPSVSMLCTQLYDRHIASEVKLTLMEVYPDDHLVVLVKRAGIAGEERVQSLPLYELDRQDWIDYLTSLFVPGLQIPFDKQLPDNNSFGVLLDIMDRLRKPDGCPWDIEQDFDTLKRYLIEETYEVIEAVEDHDMHKLQDELGDLLLQVVFYSQIAKEKGIFDINGVLRGISQKLIRRHPHVFGGEVTVTCVEDVNVNWDKIKRSENENRPRFDIPRQLPALMRAEKVQKKASKAGFDWPNIKGALAKIQEELQELKAATLANAASDVEEEVGDILFSVVNTARFLQVDPEEALTRTTDKFVKRFNYIESMAGEKGQIVEDMSLEELDKLWDEAKTKE